MIYECPYLVFNLSLKGQAKMPKTRIEVKLILINNREHYIGYFDTRPQAFEYINQIGYSQFLEAEGIADNDIVDINFNVVIDEEYYHKQVMAANNDWHTHLDKTLLLWEFDCEIAHLEAKLKDEMAKFDKYDEENGFNQDYRLYSTSSSNGVTLEDRLANLKYERLSARENY